MDGKSRLKVEGKRVELDGVGYVIVREAVFERLCDMAGVEAEPPRNAGDSAPGLDLDRASLAEKLVGRRRASGLSQAELARRAGIRPETLNRIERGRTTPDFRTVRKLVVAMNAAEREQVARKLPSSSQKEPNHANRK
ncbi:MAG: helix-turn-helix domain-containing protein [Planctomycetota bacterium]